MTTDTAPTRARRWRPRTVNPVLRRELMERWRGRRAFVVLTAYLGVLTGLMLLLLWAGSSWVEASRQFGLDQGPVLGRFLLENVLGLVLLLVLFVGPGYAAAQIAQERERRTLGLLQITMVSPFRIVLGKLGAASAWLLLLVIVSAPMAAAAFFLGGVSVGDLVRGVAYLVVVTVAIAAVGIGVSSVARRTVSAVVMTYAVVLALVVGSGFVAIIEVVVQRDDFGFNDRPVALYANPFLGLADATRAVTSVDMPSILTPFAAALPPENQADGGLFGGPFPGGGAVDARMMEMEEGVEVFDAGGGIVRAMPVPPPGPNLIEGPLGQQGDRRPVWLQVLAIQAALGALGVLVATRRVRPGRGPTPRRRRSDPDQPAVVAGQRVVAAAADLPPPPATTPVAPPPSPPVQPPEEPT